MCRLGSPGIAGVFGGRGLFQQRLLEGTCETVRPPARLPLSQAEHKMNKGARCCLRMCVALTVTMACWKLLEIVAMQ